jgi:hypothetical protein
MLGDVRNRPREAAMTDDIKTIHHMITAWNASVIPSVIPPQMMRGLGDYLVSFLKSSEGEKYLRSLGYVRAEPEGKKG